jgi:hypothetical protein
LWGQLPLPQVRDLVISAAAEAHLAVFTVLHQVQTLITAVGTITAVTADTTEDTAVMEGIEAMVAVMVVVTNVVAAAAGYE